MTTQRTPRKAFATHRNGHSLAHAVKLALSASKRIECDGPDWSAAEWVVCFPVEHREGVAAIVDDLAQSYLGRLITPEMPQRFRADCVARVRDEMRMDGVIGYATDPAAPPTRT